MLNDQNENIFSTSNRELFFFTQSLDCIENAKFVEKFIELYQFVIIMYSVIIIEW